MLRYTPPPWLVDAIASYQGTRALKTDMLKDFQIWILKVDREAKKGVLTCIADDGWPPAITQEIEYTDFPLDEITLWFANDTIHLPGEH